jgi:hypothetical protein
MTYYGNEIQYITVDDLYIQLEIGMMNAEIKELNRIICKQCTEKEYEKCKNCKVYQLINKIAAS